VKKVGDLFEELGFRKDGSDGVKRAFVENLVRAAGQTLPAQPAARAPVKEIQLSFNFEALEERGPETPFPNGKRNAG
jgi:hypothetical protein